MPRHEHVLRRPRRQRRHKHAFVDGLQAVKLLGDQPSSARAWLARAQALRDARNGQQACFRCRPCDRARYFTGAPYQGAPVRGQGVGFGV
jgi:hypothetical protein